MGFKSSSSSFGLSAWSGIALSIVVMIAGPAGPARAQSQSNEGSSFDAGAESRIRVGVKAIEFADTFVGETSNAADVVITTNVRTITLSNITVAEPFIETGCTCLFLANNVGTQVDCSPETLAEGSLAIPPATTCKIGVAFEPQSGGKVNKARGVIIDTDAADSPRHVRLVGVGVTD